MFNGLRLLTKKNRKGVTLLELLIAVVLMSVMFMAVSSLYLASRRLFVASSDKVIIGYELQYAAQHIYKYAMRGMGDKGAPAFVISAANTQLDINVHNNDLASPPSLQPLTAATYGNVTNCRYYYNSATKSLMFDKGTPMNPSDDESLIPKVTVTAVNFTQVSGSNILTGSITASYGDQSMTFFLSCYPRLASFN